MVVGWCGGSGVSVCIGGKYMVVVLGREGGVRGWYWWAVEVRASVVVDVICGLVECEMFVCGWVVRVRHTLDQVFWLWDVAGLTGMGWIVWLSLCVEVEMNFSGEDIYCMWLWLDGWGCGEYDMVENVGGIRIRVCG